MSSSLQKKQLKLAEVLPDLVGEFRRFGSAGPAYEITNLDNDGNVDVVVFASGERVTVRLEDVLKDPIAQTLP